MFRCRREISQYIVNERHGLVGELALYFQRPSFPTLETVETRMESALEVKK